MFAIIIAFEHIDPKAAHRLGPQREAFVISGKGRRPCQDPAQSFLTAGFLIVEIDLARIGSVSRTVRIASDPPR
jgi:hypothetical protein